MSPYLTQTLTTGTRLELRGPIGGWFVWRAEQTEPVQLVAGGSGIVPLIAMIRARERSRSTAPFRLLYSVREPGAVLYSEELRALAGSDDGVRIDFAYTRVAPEDSPRPPHRIDAALIEQAAWPANTSPTCYVCGPTPFVEAVAGFLTTAGHRADAVRTERFGAMGEQR